jgi:hypothetical protein
MQSVPCLMLPDSFASVKCLIIVAEEIVIADHSSRFAKSLGFYEEADWSQALPASGVPAPIDASSGEEDEEFERETGKAAEKSSAKKYRVRYNILLCVTKIIV